MQDSCPLGQTVCHPDRQGRFFVDKVPKRLAADAEALCAFGNTAEQASTNEITIARCGGKLISLYEQVGGHPIASLCEEDIHRLRKPVQQFLATGSETMLVMTHNALLIHGRIATIYSEHTASAVYLLRNPFDLAVSFASHYRLSHDDAIDAISSPYNRTRTGKIAVFQILTRWTYHTIADQGSPVRRPFSLPLPV